MSAEARIRRDVLELKKLAFALDWNPKLRRAKVETPGIEPGSKQATARLSTCLVFNWFSMYCRLKTGYTTLIFFSFGKIAKPIFPMYTFTTPLNGTPHTRAVRRCTACSPCEPRPILLLLQIRQPWRKILHRLKLWNKVLRDMFPYSTCLHFDWSRCQNQSSPWS